MTIARPLLAKVWRTPALRRAWSVCVVLGLVASLAEVAVALSLLPILASLGVDAGEGLGGFVAQLTPVGWLVLFAIASLTRAIVNWQWPVQVNRGAHEMTVSLQTRLYRALVGAHWDAVRRVAPAKLTNTLHTQAYSAGDGFSSLVSLTSACLLIAGYIVSSAFVFPQVLPLVLVMLVVMWRLNAGRSSRVLEHAEHYYGAQEDLHQRYEDWVSISRIVSLGVDSARLAGRFEDDARNAAAHAVSFSRTLAFTRITYDTGIALAVLIGVPIAWQLETPPALLAFGLLLLIRILPRIAGIHSGYQDLVGAIAPIRAIDELAEQLEKDPATPSTTRAHLVWERIELSGGGIEDKLRDDGEHWILRDINLELAHGDWLGVAGPTGAGKTTLADVMLTLLRLDAGHLRIDGQEVDDELASRWRDQAAYVPQDVVLFDASVRDNLKIYVQDATDAELETALRQAAAEFVLERLPEGLDTRVGPGGRWLSGGERQRIGIARALLRKPGFLVLDEPTAALDSATQANLMKALSELEHKMSVVLITHRPELLDLADQVVEIEDGRIVASKLAPTTM